MDTRQLIEAEIRSREEKLLALRRSAELIQAEVGAFRRTLELLPKSSKATGAVPTQSGKGRQPGSISNRWRDVFKWIVIMEREWFEAEVVCSVVKGLENRLIKPSEVRRIFDGYIEYGYIEKDATGKFRVTQAAKDKFDLLQNVEIKKGPEHSSEPFAEFGRGVVQAPGYPPVRPEGANPSTSTAVLPSPEGEDEDIPF